MKLTYCIIRIRYDNDNTNEIYDNDMNGIIIPSSPIISSGNNKE